MNVFKRIILWLAFLCACFLPAAALTVTAPENRVWEIFSIGYDAPIVEVTDLGNHTETSTSDYDSAPIRDLANEEISTEANRTLFGQSAEFKAAEETTTLYRGVNESHVAYDDAQAGLVTPNGGTATPLEHNIAPGGTLNSPFTSWTTNPDVAENFALRPGGKGVVIQADIPTSQLTASPNLRCYLPFNSEDEATAFGQTYVLEHPSIECSIRDEEGNHIKTIRKEV